MAKKKKKKSLKARRRQAALKRQRALEAEHIRREREPRRNKRWPRNRLLGAAFIVLIVLVIGVYLTWQNDGTNDGNNSISNTVMLETSMGNIKIQLFDDMPITTANFKKLIQQGIYDNTIFHRVIDGFMIQGGDPTGTGSGDPSIPTIPDEFTDHNNNTRGTIAMANKGPDTGSSQFFINLVDNPHLDTAHPVFGKVIEGIDVVDSIGKVATTGPNGVPPNKPLQDVILFKVEIIS